jgi:hypothetical protein
VQLLSGSRAKTSKVQEELLNKDYVDVPPRAVKDEDDGLAGRSARRGLRNGNKSHATRELVGRPGLDPGSSGLKGTVKRFRCVGLVAHVICFQGIVLSCVGLL